VDAAVVVIGPMAPMLARGVETVTDGGAGITVRRCRDWSRLSLTIGADADPFVVVGIDEEFDRERAFELSIECPRARIVACELHRAELSVMRAGRVHHAGAASTSQLAAILGVRLAPARFTR
jgi:hypothetical protein